MTNQQHPITPPPELVRQWLSSFYGSSIAPGEAYIDVATQAARWGADQELEACCRWLRDPQLGLGAGYEELIHPLRAARRPKPLSLKEQSLALIDLLEQLSPPQPIPVSERLPGPEDCDAEGRCWWWYPPVPEQTYGYWVYEDDAVPERALAEQPCHWLPFNALPMPSGEVSQ